MQLDDLDASIVDWVIDHPESIAIFEEHGIDYCCAGKSFSYGCLARGIDPRYVAQRILGASRSEPDSSAAER